MNHAASLVLVASAALGLGGIAAAVQEAPPPAPAAPEAGPPFGFNDADRSDASRQAAARRLESAQRTYREAPTLTDRAAVVIEAPGRRDTDAFAFRFGSGGDAALALQGANAIARDGTVTFAADVPKDRALVLPLEGDLLRTLRKALPNFGLPAPQFALRYGEAIAAADLALDSLADPAIAGYREVDGRAEVLLAGRGDGHVVLTFDGATSLLQRARARFTPQGAPPTFVLSIDISYQPMVAETLAEPIALDIAGRDVVTRWEDFLPRPVAVGQASPEWTLKRADGSTVSLGELRGSVVVLDFWATWCGPCKRGLPFVSEFASWAAGSGLPIQVFGVNTLENGGPNERVTKASDFWGKGQFAMPLLFDLDDSAFRAYGLDGIPATIVIGADGIIAAIHTGIDPKNPGGIVTILKDETTRLAKGTAAGGNPG